MASNEKTFVKAPPEAPCPVSDLDWSPERARSFGERALDLWADLLRDIRRLPIAAPWTVEEIRRAVTRPIPDEPLSEAEILNHVRQLFFEASAQPGNPRFMGYISGAGTVPGAVAELLAAGINQNVSGWRLSPGASEIELHLMRWLCDLFGLPSTAAGLTVAGGAVANFVALKIARDTKANWDVRRLGTRSGPPLAIYGSEECHISMERSLDLLGLGSASLRRIPTDQTHRMIPSALVDRLEADRRNGTTPVAVVATAGTTATGAIDPLPAIANICAERGIWLHVDAAYGGAVALSDDHRPLLAGIERADSVTFDPHKWMYVAQSASVVLLRDMGLAERSFMVDAGYVFEDKEQTGTGIDFGDYGPQWSRGFQAFKVWISLLAHGRTAYARRIAHDVELAAYLAHRIRQRLDFELMTEPSLSICCFRYAPPDTAGWPDREGYLDTLNERLMTQLQADGRAYCSNAVLNGRFVLRACVVNFRTEALDMDALLDTAAAIGEALHQRLQGAKQS